MVALHKSFARPEREPHWMQDAAFIREARREAYETAAQEQEDFEYRAPVQEGRDEQEAGL